MHELNFDTVDVCDLPHYILVSVVLEVLGIILDDPLYPVDEDRDAGVDSRDALSAAAIAPRYYACSVPSSVNLPAHQWTPAITLNTTKKRNEIETLITNVSHHLHLSFIPEATFVKSTNTFFENHLNLVMSVFIGYLSRSVLKDEYPCARVSVNSRFFA